MNKCDDDLQREFYLRMAKRYGWTKRLLANHIESRMYERLLMSQTNLPSPEAIARSLLSFDLDE